MVSKTGYRDDSPDKNNPYNIIPSNRISMKGVSIPLIGVPIIGGKPDFSGMQIMTPGEKEEYVFDFYAEAVLEVPLPSEDLSPEELQAYVLRVLEQGQKQVASTKCGGMVRSFKRTSKMSLGGAFGNMMLPPDLTGMGQNASGKKTFKEGWGDFKKSFVDFVKSTEGASTLGVMGSNIFGKMLIKPYERRLEKEKNELAKANWNYSNAVQQRNLEDLGWATYSIARHGGKIGSRVIKKKEHGGNIAAAIGSTIRAVAPVLPFPFSIAATGIGSILGIGASIKELNKLIYDTRKQRKLTENMLANFRLTGNETMNYV